MHRSNIFLGLFLLVAPVLSAQDATDSSTVVTWLKNLAPFRQEGLAPLIIRAGELQLGTPYKAGLLDESPREVLRITTKGADCVLFVENAVAAAWSATAGDLSFQGFSDRIKLLRYRNGTVTGYGSRKHYFTEWMIDLAREKRLEFITHAGAVPLQPVHFMTSNPGSYPKLADAATRNDVSGAEQKINAAQLTYWPKATVSSSLSLLKDGDIIGFVTTVKGLDVSHTAIFVRKDGRETFLHASTKGSVMVEPLGLTGYLDSRKSLSGILVGRLVR